MMSHLHVRFDDYVVEVLTRAELEAQVTRAPLGLDPPSASDTAVTLNDAYYEEQEALDDRREWA
jgi:hypothetical protein